MNYGIIYRSCDRPKYVEKTLPILIDNSSMNGHVLVFDNSTDDGRRDAVKEIVDHHTEKNFWIKSYFSPEARIGGTKAIIQGVKILRKEFKLDAIMIVDDDVAVPRKILTDGGQYVHWDDVLADMLHAGWNVAAHPWATGFRDNPIKEYGGVKGHAISGVGGGCSGFRLDFYDNHPMEQQTLIRGYNEWMVRHTKGNRCGYSHDHSMLIEHIDRPEHPWSLRDTEYNEWSDAMFYERFPNFKREGKERPKGAKGIW